jgi:hypothetical protein
MSDSTHPTAQLVADVRRLERKVRRLQTVLLGSAFAACAVAAMAFTTKRPLASADTVTTKRLVLVDENGTPGATMELVSVVIPGAQGPSGRRTAESLNITVDDPPSDSARNPSDSTKDVLWRGHAAVALNGQGLSVTLSPPGSVPPQESGLRLDPGPTFQLRRGDQSVYRIEPTRGVRPVLGLQ